MKNWLLCVTCCGRQVGREIECDQWNITDRLAAMRLCIAGLAGWEAHAHPVEARVPARAEN